ncbi:MAG: hypothetical protein UX86_C0020G0001 [Candidatus Amesbacteria bacterium GW2011_GWC1_47_15]|uniref:Homing endonuclease LAGLIDADG domain-containing protein n=1 Tax=Candidatus Amesbacteria bacterium GW2011_GWC1_47_15 TaxID=1618364 RepID=A0A0G1V103_9BACT|nr:MAG: hypothetical protein UX86_C0020G0001 [Candidatus Amesbacteria bacterium GW2011_GWC1_47_15]
MKHHLVDTEQDNQQERLVSDDYLLGFVEGEGCFYIGVVRSRETISHWQVIYFFKVSQNPTGKLVLEQLKNRLACGYIKANSLSDKSDKSLAFVVRDLPSLTKKVIPFFKGKLLTKKAEDFEKFCRVIDLVISSNHLTKKGITKILDIAYSMNTAKRRYSKQEILAGYN